MTSPFPERDMKMDPKTSLAVAALVAVLACAACQGTSGSNRSASKSEAAQAYGECLVDNYYEGEQTDPNIEIALDVCEESGTVYARYLVRDYRSNYSDVLYNTRMYMYPVVRRQGAELLRGLAQP